MTDHSTMRDQKLPAGNNSRRSKFTTNAILAIEELEIRRVSRSPEQLAAAAWQKLQFDLPVLELAELQALLEQLRSSLQGKTSWPCYTITNKALENITCGAKRATSFEPVLSEHEQQLQQLLAESISNTIRSKTQQTPSSTSCHKSSATSSSRQDSAAAAPGQQRSQQNGQQQVDAAQPASPQHLYQQLCAVVLLQYMSKVASLPEQEAWQLLQEYQPEREQEQQPDAPQHPYHQQQEQQQQQGQLDAFLPSLGAAAGTDDACAGSTQQQQAAAAAVSLLPASTTTSSTSIYELQEAAVQDEDWNVYEAFEPLELSAAANSSSSSRSRPNSSASPQQRQSQCSPSRSAAAEQYSWPALLHKLTTIAEHVHYSLLSYEPLWRDQAAAQHLLQLLRALGVHSQAGQLQPVLHAYVGLLVDRLAAAPADLPLLQQLWEALGLSGLNAGNSGLKQKPRQVKGQALPAEAVLGFSVAASVWQQLPAGSVRGRLWRLMYDNLLSLLEQCSEQLAYNSSSAAAVKLQARSSSSSSAGLEHCTAATAAGTAGATMESFAHMLLLSHVVELLVLGRPGSVDVAVQLTQQGVMRNLVQLFAQHAADAAADPLRRAVLLASCSSHKAANWVLAVPSVLQQLQQQVFQLEGPAEAHGALWELLINSRARQADPIQTAANHAGAAGGASSSACGQLLALLALCPSNVQQLQRQVALLQLLVDVQKAAGRQQLWGDAVQAALKQLAARIKDTQGSSTAPADAAAPAAGDGTSTGVIGGPTAAASAAAVKKSSSGSDDDDAAEDDKEEVTSKDSKTERQQQWQRTASVPNEAALAHRHSQQLHPAALKFIKELLTQGGKTD